MLGNETMSTPVMPSWYPLIGGHDVAIDEKGRLLIPVEVRKRLDNFGEGDALILVNMGGRGFLYPEKYQMSRIGGFRVSIVPSVREQELTRALFGPSVRLAWDKQGRILLSPKTVAGLKLEREISLVCCGDHLELWNRLDWENEQARLSLAMPDLISAMSGQIGDAVQ